MGSARVRQQASGMTIQSTDRSTHDKQLVREFIQDLFTRGDLSAVDRYLDPAFVDHDAPFPGAPEGPEGMRLAAETFRRACPDWRSDLDQIVAEDDIVVERFTASGHRTGELMGVPPAGERLVLRGINVFRIRGDRIVERWGRLDEMGLAHQLGLVDR
jgi:predicted ester cyclase